MSEEKNEVVVEEVVQEVVDYKAMAEQLQAKASEYEKRLEAVDRKNKEMLGEKKAAQEAAKRAEAEKALKDGDWQKQLEIMKEAYTNLENEYKGTLGSIKEEKVKNTAMQVAGDIASNAKNAKVLSTLIELELKSMTDEKGHIDGDVVNALRAKYKNDDTYSSLVAGSKAVGAGAPGSSTSGHTSNEKTYADLQKMSPADRLAFGNLVKSGQAKLI